MAADTATPWVAPTRWTWEEIWTWNLVQISVDKSSLFRTFFITSPKIHWPICEAHRATSSSSSSLLLSSLESSDTQSLWDLNTSPPRNRATVLLDKNNLSHSFNTSMHCKGKFELHVRTKPDIRRGLHRWSATNSVISGTDKIAHNIVTALQAPGLESQGRTVWSSLFFSSTLKPRVEWYTSLCASNTSPHRNRFTFLRSSCSEIRFGPAARDGGFSQNCYVGRCTARASTPEMCSGSEAGS